MDTSRSSDIRLLSNQVLVRVLNPERQTHGLWIPDSAKRQDYELYRGVVLAHGPGARSKRGRLTPCDVKPGDRVLFYWLAGKVNVTKWPDDEHQIVKEDFIQAVLN